MLLAGHLSAPTRISNLNPGLDVAATLSAITALGANIAHESADSVTVGNGALHDAQNTVNCRNSGSTARMIAGVCAGANLRATLDGDASLRARPMEPVAAQLRAFGAEIRTESGRLPMVLGGTLQIETRAFILLAPSAQVKTALLLAGLYAGVPISISGDRSSRDHTERLLQYFGGNIRWDGKTVALGTRALVARPVRVPGDLSAAAFFITAAAIVPESAIVIPAVGVNPTRTGSIDALRAMGADIELSNQRDVAGEPVADIAVRYAPLSATAIDAGLTFRAIDEVPLLAIAAAFAHGTTTISGIKDLRSKESDRVSAIETLLASVGVQTHSGAGNTLTIEGGAPRAPRDLTVSAHADHRIAMTAAVLACGAGPLEIDDARSIAVSFSQLSRRTRASAKRLKTQTDCGDLRCRPRSWRSRSSYVPGYRPCVRRPPEFGQSAAQTDRSSSSRSNCLRAGRTVAYARSRAPA